MSGIYLYIYAQIVYTDTFRVLIAVGDQCYFVSDERYSFHSLQWTVIGIYVYLLRAWRWCGCFTCCINNTLRIPLSCQYQGAIDRQDKRYVSTSWRYTTSTFRISSNMRQNCVTFEMWGQVTRLYGKIVLLAIINLINLDRIKRKVAPRHLTKFYRKTHSLWGFFSSHFFFFSR